MEDRLERLFGMSSDLIRDYISRYKNSSESPKSSSGYLLRHISLLDDHGYPNWDVFITAGSSDQTTATFDLFGKPVYRERRAPGRGTNKATFFISRMRLSSRGVEKAPLNDQQIQQAEQQFKAKNPAKSNVADLYYRHIPGRRPLLILHPIAMQFKSKVTYNTWLKPKKNGGDASIWPSADHIETTVGWSISFPEVGIKEEVTYVYNDVMLNQIGHDFDTEEDDDDAPDL